MCVSRPFRKRQFQMITIRKPAGTSWTSVRLPQVSGAFWALSLLLVACFALGGSARGEVASLMVLRPLAILLLGFGLWCLKFEQVKAHWFLFAMGLAILALPALQLIPMPQVLWSQLPGRNLVMEIDKAAGLGQVWRPLSLTPGATRNALFAAIVPFAVLVLGVQLGSEERFRLLPLVLGLGGFSALLGLVQTLGDPNGWLYFYDTTNNGSAVGLFANRNHQALLLAMMLPMLAVLAHGRGLSGGTRQLIALVSGLLLLPFILITGSRSGMIVAAIALLAVPLVVGRTLHLAGPLPGKAGSGRKPLFGSRLGLVLLAAGLVLLTIWLGRGLAWERLLTSEPTDDLRAKILPTLFSMIRVYFPLGSGMGSFEQIYQVHEPDALLSPTYMNHAHNDWLEVLLTGGAASAVLLIIAVAGFLLQSRRAFSVPAASSASVKYARLGLVMLMLAGLASISDYPLRVPSLASLLTLALLWTGCSLPKSHPKSAP